MPSYHSFGWRCIHPLLVSGGAALRFLLWASAALCPRGTQEEEEESATTPNKEMESTTTQTEGRAPPPTDAPRTEPNQAKPYMHTTPLHATPHDTTRPHTTKINKSHNKNHNQLYKCILEAEEQKRRTKFKRKLKVHEEKNKSKKKIQRTSKEQCKVEKMEKHISHNMFARSIRAEKIFTRGRPKRSTSRRGLTAAVGAGQNSGRRFLCGALG